MLRAVSEVSEAVDVALKASFARMECGLYHNDGPSWRKPCQCHLRHPDVVESVKRSLRSRLKRHIKRPLPGIA